MVDEFELFPKSYMFQGMILWLINGVPSMKAAVYDISYQNAYNIYGNPLPKYVQERLDKELDAIIGHGYFRFIIFHIYLLKIQMMQVM